MKWTLYEKARAPDMPQINQLANLCLRSQSVGNSCGASVAHPRRTARAGRCSAHRRRVPPDRIGWGADITPANARFFASPLPVVLHIVAATAYIVLGAFQFVPGFRRRMPGWHRRVGRLLVGSGLVAALSGLWMSQFYRLPDHDGALLYGFRLLFGSMMAISMVLGFVAIGAARSPATAPG